MSAGHDLFISPEDNVVDAARGAVARFTGGLAAYAAPDVSEYRIGHRADRAMTGFRSAMSLAIVEGAKALGRAHDMVIERSKGLGASHLLASAMRRLSGNTGARGVEIGDRFQSARADEAPRTVSFVARDIAQGAVVEANALARAALRESLAVQRADGPNLASLAKFFTKNAYAAPAGENASPDGFLSLAKRTMGAGVIAGLSLNLVAPSEAQAGWLDNPGNMGMAFAGGILAGKIAGAIAQSAQHPKHKHATTYQQGYPSGAQVYSPGMVGAQPRYLVRTPGLNVMRNNGTVPDLTGLFR